MKTVQDDVSASAKDSNAQSEQSSTSLADSIVDLDVLRGWSEHQDPALRQHHHLPALAELIELDENNQHRQRYGLYGPDLLLGRFQSQYAPIDVVFRNFKDHQTYRLGAPHAHLSLDQGQWKLDALSPRSETRVNTHALTHLQEPRIIVDDDVITLGVTKFRFRITETTIERWHEERQRIFDRVNEPALFLKRNGGPCGPLCRLNERGVLILGRSYPAPGVLPGTANWPAPDKSTWDLSGLHGFERRFIAFRHAAISLRRGRWTIKPISTRQRTFVNRIAISGTIALESGDEVALGSVLFRFHHPHRNLETSRPRHVPAVVDWSEGRTPSLPAEEDD